MDAENAKKSKLSGVLLKRLVLDENKIDEMIDEVKSVAKLEDPVGKVLSQTELDQGLMLYQVTS